MSEQGQLIEASVSPVYPPKYEPKAETTWMIWTWYAPWKHWKQWPDQFVMVEKAHELGKRILSDVRGHTHYIVVKIELPGN